MKSYFTPYLKTGLAGTALGILLVFGIWVWNRIRQRQLEMQLNEPENPEIG